MPRILLFATMLLALIPAPPLSHSATVECMTPDNVRARIGQAVAPEDILQLQGREAVSFLKSFNALPPQTNHMADAFLIVANERLPVHLVFAFKSGCLVGRSSLDRKTSASILSRIIGMGV